MNMTDVTMRMAGQALAGGVIVVIAGAAISGINAWGAEHIINSAMVAGVITAALGLFTLISAAIWSAD